MTVIEEYLFYHEKYEKKYGADKTVVLYQNGSFHEMYATEKRGPKLNELCSLLNLTFTKKDKKTPTVDEKNPNLAGFPTVALNKYLKILIEYGYTVVVVDQTTSPPNPKREITGVYSTGTYINESLSPDSNNILCLYIEEEKQKNGSFLMCIGMSVVDLSTGENSVHESFSLNGDERFALDEAVRFISSFNPKEIIIYRQEQKSNLKKDSLISYLEMENKNFYYHDKINKNFLKIDYQNEFLSKIYPDGGMLSTIEFLDLEKNIYAVVSFVALMDFCYQHNENIIKYLHKPKIFQTNSHLILGNNALYQLNILENKIYEISNNRFKSLFDVVNNTSTAMGRRYLKNILATPYTSTETIQAIYDATEEIIEDDFYLQIDEQLKAIIDLERLHRKMALKNIFPFEFGHLMESYNNVVALIDMIRKTKRLKIYMPDNVTLKSLKEFILDTDKTFLINELKKYNINEISNSFFKPGCYAKIDDLQTKINDDVNFMNNLCVVLSKHIDDVGKSKFFQKKEKENDNEELDQDDSNTKIYLRKNDRDGYYLNLTKLRANSLKKNLQGIKSIKITDSYSIDPQTIEFRELSKGNTKIFFKDLSKKSDNMLLLKEKFMTLIKESFESKLSEYFNKYGSLFAKIVEFVSFLDYLKSNAKTAKSYNYSKPIIIKKDGNQLTNGFFRGIGIRHPIIERIRTEYEYVPHNVSLGKDENWKEGDNHLDGMLLFGLNSVGKCFHLETKLLLATGEKIKAKNIKLGEQLMGDDSLPRNVLSVTRGKGVMYQISPSKFDSFIVNGAHILCLKRKRDDNILEITVEDYLNKINNNKIDKEYQLYYNPVEFNERETCTDPYVEGSQLCSNQQKGAQRIQSNFICNSKRNRLKILAGIIDTDGNALNDKGISLFAKDSKFADDIIFIVKSLGMYYHKSKFRNIFKITISGERLQDLIPYLKKSVCLRGNYNCELTDSFKIEKLGIDNYIGFEVDCNKRFLLGDLTVTHNSSFMKAIGLNIVMAQCGLYVPATKFEYSPYDSLYARITGTDNLFKGLSSFSLEMTELRAILKRTGPKTLVIGDEICRSTEHISGNAIVASSIICLAKTGSTFIFATHLHEIPKMPRIIDLKNVKSFHLSVQYDKAKDLLIFERHLKDGPGEPVYGLTVCQYIIHDKEFLELANSIKNELLNTSGKLLNNKTSNYNSKVFVNECQICGKKINENSDSKNLETHHIVAKKLFDKDKNISGKGLKRDQKANLIILCKNCHDTITYTENLTVEKYVPTTKGKKIVVKAKDGHILSNNNNIILKEE